MKALITIIKQGKMNKDEIERNIEKIFGKGCKEEIEKVTITEKIVERVEEMSKRETQLEEWETMRKETKRRQREDRRLNLFWRRNKTFPMQFGGDEETPGVEETLEFWRRINNKEVPEGWKEDRDIRGALYDVKKLLQKGRMCRWFEFTEKEFDEVLRCTAPWKACGVDSVYSFPSRNARQSEKPCTNW